MTPGKFTVVELNLFRHRQPNSRGEGIFKFCHQLTKLETGPLRKVASPVLLPTVAGNLEALIFWEERICLHAMELVPSVFDILEYFKNILPSVESL